MACVETDYIDIHCNGPVHLSRKDMGSGVRTYGFGCSKSDCSGKKEHNHPIHLKRKWILNITKRCFWPTMDLVSCWWFQPDKDLSNESNGVKINDVSNWNHLTRYTSTLKWDHSNYYQHLSTLPMHDFSRKSLQQIASKTALFPPLG